MTLSRKPQGQRPGPPPAPPPDPSSTGGDPVVLDLVLYPHRSLSKTGFLVLMAAIVGCSMAVGVAFLLAGAWPVFGFFGLDVLLIYAGFRLNYRAARAYETVRLTPKTLEIVKVDPAGRAMRTELTPAWLSVDLAEPDEWSKRLTLRSAGRDIEIGAFLPPEEKVGLAEALRDGLRRVHAPAL